MAVSRTPAPADCGPASHIVDAAAARPPYPPVPVPFTGQSPWARVIRHARCADSSLDPDHWFPVSVETDKAGREAATAIAVCTACRTSQLTRGPREGIGVAGYAARVTSPGDRVTCPRLSPTLTAAGSSP